MCLCVKWWLTLACWRVWKMGLTTIISEGSRTMHSHPRRRLPADRFPKLDKEKNRNKMQNKSQHSLEESVRLCHLTVSAVTESTLAFSFWARPLPKSTQSPAGAYKSHCAQHLKYAVWNSCIKCETEQHWMDSSPFQQRPPPPHSPPPTWWETPASGKVHSHDVTACTLLQPHTP